MNTDSSIFTFSDGNQIVDQLQKDPEHLQTGYWEFCFSSSTAEGLKRRLTLGISQGKLIYAGAKPRLTWPILTDILQQGLPELRTSAAREKIQQVENAVPPSQRSLLGSMVSKLIKERLLEYHDVLHIFRNKVLFGLEDILSAGACKATFTTDYKLVTSAPIQGFEFESLLSDIVKRRAQWSQLQSLVPTMEGIPELDTQSLQQSNLQLRQKDKLKQLIGQGKTLRQLASRLGKDPLDIATTFSGLIRKQLVTLKLPDTHKGALPPKIFIVDDSQLLIQQFQQLMINWGYRVGYASDALHAVDAIDKAEPDVIFLDINMPGASGFELIKSIRRTPQIASVPLVLLTAESTVSNQWRAQWASCKFLAKPRTSADVPKFQETLKALLSEVVPRSTEQPVQLQSRTLHLQTA